jgi:hypothetical protein
LSDNARCRGQSLVTGVVRIGHFRAAPGTGNIQPMLDDRLEAALLEVTVARRALADLEASLVVQARAVGATWTEIAAPLSLTKQGVRKRHLAVDPIYARRTQRPPTLDEYYAEMYAALGRAPG